MEQEYDTQQMVAKIQALRKEAESLKKISSNIPTVQKNVDRILANIRMLEISISDAAKIQGK